MQVLLAVRNGAPYLSDQLESIAAQQHRDWSLLVGDDGSTDGATELVDRFARREGNGRVRLLRGPQKGLAANFLTLLWQTPPGSAVAFCDQDDVWMPHKLGRALEHIEAAGDGIVAYSCRTIETDSKLRPMKLSPWPACGPSFGNALVQNILAGNSLVLSPLAADMLRCTVPGAIKANVPFHDWWTYLLLSGAGGRIVLDREPGIYYRQHAACTQGSSHGLVARLRRASKVISGVYADWISRNIASLQIHRGLLTSTARATLSEFAAARAESPRKLANHMETLGIRRQTKNGDRALKVLARLHRL